MKNSSLNDPFFFKLKHSEIATALEEKAQLWQLEVKVRLDLEPIHAKFGLAVRFIIYKILIVTITEKVL